MKNVTIIVSIFITLLLISLTRSEPGFNGTSPGCGDSGCHNVQTGIVSAEVLSNFQVRVTLTGTTSKVGGELVNSGGVVVNVINSTSDNPFILTAPSAGTYTVNAGFKNPSLSWESTSAVINVTGVDEKLVGLNPVEFELYPNFPNPFNPSTKIRYAISETAFTTIRIYSLIGQEISLLINEEKSPGIYEVNFDASDFNLTTGTYLYKLQTGNFVQTKKMILLK
jgi:hypothetical protein